MDLISLDSPFLPEPVVSLSQAILSSPAPVHNPVSEVRQAIYSPEQDFTRIWNAREKHNARGWTEAPLDVIVRRLQTIQLHLVVLSADQPPFEGDCCSIHFFRRFGCDHPAFSSLGFQAN